MVVEPRPNSASHSVFARSWFETAAFLPDPIVVPNDEARARMAATKLAWKVRDRKTGIVMLLVAPGEFMMGSTATERMVAVQSVPQEQREQYAESVKSESRRLVTIARPFYLSETEVSQEAWQSLMGANPSHFVEAQNPVEQVSWEEAVAFAQRNDLLVCHDAPYLDVTYDGYTAPSILQVPGALEVAVEFNSLSKTYNMAGWRMGMAVGCAAAVRALHALKSNIDSSQFKAAQLAGVAALTGDQTWLAPRNALYQERRDAVLAGLRQAQLPAQTPAGAMYVWAQVPAGMGSEQFADDLLEQASVSVTPGAIYGVNGEGYFRISLGTATPRVREAMERIAEWARARS